MLTSNVLLFTCPGKLFLKVVLIEWVTHSWLMVESSVSKIEALGYIYVSVLRFTAIIIYLHLRG